MTESVEEQVVLLDPTGRPCGTAPKATVHQSSTPYHLAFSCYVFNRDNELLVSQRAWTKPTWPGVWTNSCCGHPTPGEFVEDAVYRRLSAELGLVPVELSLALPSFRYRAQRDGIEEHELCPVYLARVDAEPTPNPAEVADIAWCSFEDFAGRSDISPWARMQVRLLTEYVPIFLRQSSRLRIEHDQVGPRN